MLRLKFKDTASRDQFADRFKLTTTVNDVELDIEWHLLQFAKVDENCTDYEEVAVLKATPDANSEQEFIVKGDPTKFSAHATVVADLGKGFYHVKSTDGTMLGDYVDFIEHNSTPVKLMGTMDIMDMPVIPNLDPTGSDAQWARLRVASKYRPLLTTFSTYGCNYQSKPELIVIDSGINFDHPEFSYEGLDTEDYFKLPDFDSYRDDVGHGTAVASCAVGKNLGVAQHCKLVNVKIGNKDRHATLLELGTAFDAILNRVSADPQVTRVVNISWVVARSAWLDSKVEALQSAGITVVCAAGNNGIDVELMSPAGIDSVITVGSVDKYDIPSGFNNISPSDANITTGSGLSLDIFAPGENVVLASKDGGYGYDSGTSFAAPYVAGCAVSVASLIKGLVPYADLKNYVLKTSTKDALLFEDNTFSENQNALVHLAISDINSNNKVTDLISYVGYVSEETPEILINVENVLNTNIPFVEKGKLSIKFLDDQLAEKYGSYITLDEVKKEIKITYPKFDMPEETKLVMVKFQLVSESTQLKQESSTLFFYDTNHNYKTTLESDLTLALTNTNSVSFYAASFSIK